MGNSICLIAFDTVTYLRAGTRHHHRRGGGGRLRPVEDGRVDVGRLQHLDLHAAEQRDDGDRYP